MSRTSPTRPVITANRPARDLRGQAQLKQTVLEDRQSIADLMTGWIHRDLAEWEKLNLDL